jgi:hypothetical protein
MTSQGHTYGYCLKDYRKHPAGNNVLPLQPAEMQPNGLFCMVNWAESCLIGPKISTFIPLDD